MTVNFPARRSGSHFTGDLGRTGGPVLSRRNLLKLGAGSAAAAAAGAYGINRAMGRNGIRHIDDTSAYRPVKLLSLVGTDGWISMPDGAISNPALHTADPGIVFAGGAAPGGPIWPDAFAPANRNLYIFGFAAGGRFETPNRLDWASVYNGTDSQGRATAVGGMAALKNRANLAAPILYYHEGDDIRITLWNAGMANRPDIVDAHTIHWHGFPNQIPYFDGVPNDSLAVPIGSNLVYRYLPYKGMAGCYMWHCHVSDAEHVQMGLQSIVFIRPYQNYGNTAGGIPMARAGYLDLLNSGANPAALPSMAGPGTFPYQGPLGYVYNDGVPVTLSAPGQYPSGSTAYDREFAFILDEMDARVHYDDAHFLEQDFSQWAPKFPIINGRAWPDTIAGNWDVTQLDWTDSSRANNHYNVATVDQVLTNPTETNPASWNLDPTAYVTSDRRLGSQPWSSLIQANAGETICLRFANLGYAEHDMELSGLQFTVIGEDAKNLLAGRDGYEQNPNPNDNSFSPMTAKRANISFKTSRTALGPAESRELLIQIPSDAYNTNGTPVVFEFFDRNGSTNSNAVAGGPLAGGMRTQLHVFPPGKLPPQNYPQQVFNGGVYQ